LTDHKFWSKSGAYIVPDGLFNEKFMKKDLVQNIEKSSGALMKMRRLVGEYWRMIEEEAKIERRKKYE
jgi:hypothetical protein